MIKRILLLLAAIGVALGLSLVATPSASAHGSDGRNNVIQNQCNSGGALGIINHWSDGGWSFLINRCENTTMDGTDFDGFYVGYGACADVWQSNDNRTYGYYGNIRGPYKMQTTYWLWNKVRWYGC